MDELDPLSYGLQKQPYPIRWGQLHGSHAIKLSQKPNPQKYCSHEIPSENQPFYPVGMEKRIQQLIRPFHSLPHGCKL